MPNKPQRDYLFGLLDYAPSQPQRDIHESTARIRLVTGGERSGKSTLASKELMSRFYEGKLYWLVGEEYDLTRAEFEYICDDLDKLGWTYKATSRVDPGEINIKGGYTVKTKSAKDRRKLAVEAPDGIIACEAALLSHTSFLKLRGRAAEKRAWLLLEGTLEGSLGWYPELYERWRGANTEDAASFSLPTWTNLAIFPGGRNDPEILALEAATSKEWFLERYGGEPCPPAGRVFSEFSTLYHTADDETCGFNPALPVYLWIDPGYATAYAVEAAQKVGDEINIIDEIYERNLVTSEIIKLCKQKPWWNQVLGGAIDIAATQHQAMPAPVETWLKEAGIKLAMKKLAIRDGIEIVKRYLILNPITNKPLMHINSRCTGLISELGGCLNPITNQQEVYSWKRDKEGNIIGETPEDRYNHASKAIAYGLVALCGVPILHQRRVAKVVRH